MAYILNQGELKDIAGTTEALGIRTTRYNVNITYPGSFYSGDVRDQRP